MSNACCAVDAVVRERRTQHTEREGVLEGKMQRIRSTRAAASVSNNAREDGGPRLQSFPLPNQQTERRCLSPLPSLSSLLLVIVFNHGPAQCVGSAGGDLTSGTYGRPAPQLELLYSFIHGRRPRHTRDAHAVMPPQNLCSSHHQHTGPVLLFFT